MDYYNPAAGCPGCGGGSPAFAVPAAAPNIPNISNMPNIPSNKYTEMMPAPAPAQIMPSNKFKDPAQPTTGAFPSVGRVPTMEEIASYNYMNPTQREQQRQQLEQSGSVLFPGMPGYPGRSAMAQAPAQMQAQTSAQPTAGSGLPALTPTTAQAGALTGDSLQYLNGFLRTQIGRPVLVTFLVGTNTLTDRSGTLVGVGINYILINESQTDDILACDFYNIKFVRFYY